VEIRAAAPVPLLFPASPAIGTTYKNYVWDGAKWVRSPVSSGGAGLPGQWVEVSRAVADDSAAIVFTLDASADEWMIRYYNAKGDDSDFGLTLQLSDDGGATWEEGYCWAGFVGDDEDESPVWRFDDDQDLRVNGVGDSNDTAGQSGTIVLIRPADATNPTQFEWDFSGLRNSTGYPYKVSVSGASDGAYAVDAVRLAFDTDGANLCASGTFVLLKRLKP
jgi:hypothetical protein